MNPVGNLTCEHIDYKPVIPAIMANFTLLLCLKNGLQNPLSIVKPIGMEIVLLQLIMK